MFSFAQASSPLIYSCHIFLTILNCLLLSALLCFQLSALSARSSDHSPHPPVISISTLPQRAEAPSLPSVKGWKIHQLNLPGFCCRCSLFCLQLLWSPEFRKDWVGSRLIQENDLRSAYWSPCCVHSHTVSANHKNSPGSSDTGPFMSLYNRQCFSSLTNVNRTTIPCYVTHGPHLVWMEMCIHLLKYTHFTN